MTRRFRQAIMLGLIGSSAACTSPATFAGNPPLATGTAAKPSGTGTPMIDATRLEEVPHGAEAVFGATRAGRLAFSTASGLYWAEPGMAAQQVDGAAGLVRQLQWAADGGSFVYTNPTGGPAATSAGATHDLVLVQLEPSAARILRPGLLGPIVALAGGGDPIAVAETAPDAPRGVEILSREGASQGRFAADRLIRSLRWSPDGRKLGFEAAATEVGGQPTFHELDLATGATRLVAERGGGDASLFFWRRSSGAWARLDYRSPRRELVVTDFGAGESPAPPLVIGLPAAGPGSYLSGFVMNDEGSAILADLHGDRTRRELVGVAIVDLTTATVSVVQPQGRAIGWFGGGSRFIYGKGSGATQTIHLGDAER